MRWTFKLWLFVADLLHPNRCPVCKEFLPYDQTLCEKCLSGLVLIGDSICPRCGKKDCICERICYDACLTFIEYEGTGKRGILAMKKPEGASFARHFAAVAAGRLDALGFISDTDIVTAVPTDKQKLRETGYNHAKVFAKYICSETGLNFNGRLLVKNRKALSQHSLNAADRAANAEKAYSFGKGDVSGKTVLLCDDVITTAATLNSCTKALKEHGAKRVICCTIAGTTLKSAEHTE